jgi:hypothetical protein
LLRSITRRLFRKHVGLDQVVGVMVQITPGLSGEEYVQLEEGISR